MVIVSLVAKTSHAGQILNKSPSLRGVVMRPSLVWTKDRPGALLPVAAFHLGRYSVICVEDGLDFGAAALITTPRYRAI